jgi:nitrite reductase (NADH) small subunit
VSDLVSLIGLTEVADGKSLEVTASGKIFAIYNVDGRIHVIDGICPHAGGPLGKGMLRGTVVTCPWHGWQFDVSTGHHCLNDRICQTRYDVEIQDGKICVRLPS